MKIQTTKLLEALSTLNNAVTYDITKPKYSFIELSVTDGHLYGYTNNDRIAINVDIDECSEEFEATVDFNTLYNIIKSIDNDEVTLKIHKNNLVVTSASMKIKVNIIRKAPKPGSTEVEDIIRKMRIKCDTFDNTIDFSSLSNYTSLIKSILRLDLVIECYRHVYFNECILFTDTDNAILIDDNILPHNILLSYESINILSKLKEANYTIKEDKLFVQSNNTKYAIKLPKIDDYQYDDFINLFNESFTDKCSIDGNELANALKLSNNLAYSNIYITFNDKGVFIEIPQVEFMYKISDDTCKETHYRTNKDLLKKLLITKENFDLYYSNPKLIKIEYNNITGIFSLEE